jgi:hypothetical protein
MSRCVSLLQKEKRNLHSTNNNQKLCSVVNIESKKVLQRDLDKKIRLSCKTTSNKSVSSLVDKYNKYSEVEYTTISLVKKDWTNVDKNNLDKLGLARQTRL